jgi:GNAT superfamily N-acetyltransferase
MIHIRSMAAADLSLGLRLCQQAGWNQTRSDWQRFLELQPDGCFVAEWNGLPAGTTTTCVFGPVAWIAMVLVDEAVRGRGIGTALLSHALTFLDRQGVATVRLDATPLGHPLYERLGFAEQFRLARYGGVLSPTTDDTDGEQALPRHWEALAALDKEVTATDRRRLLFRLFTEQPADVRCAFQGGRLAGFLAARPGRTAAQIGPCIAAPEAGLLLLTEACSRYAGERILVDIPVANERATRLAEAHGLSIERQLTRMCRGVPRGERLEWLWASSGPEKG